MWKKILVSVVIVVLLAYSVVATAGVRSAMVEVEEQEALIAEQQELLNEMSAQMGELAYEKGSLRGVAYELLFERVWYGDEYDLRLKCFEKALEHNVDREELLVMAQSLLDEYQAEAR